MANYHRQKDIDIHELASLHRVQTLSSRFGLGILFYLRQKKKKKSPERKGSALKPSGSLPSSPALAGLLFPTLVRELSCSFSNKHFHAQSDLATLAYSDYANIIKILKGD